MDHNETDEALGPRPRRDWHDHLTLVAAITFGAATVLLGSMTLFGQSEQSRADQKRQTDEAEVTDFAMEYFASSCAERSENMQFPLERWFNWSNGDLLRTYAKEESPNIYIPVTTQDPDTAVMGSVQYRDQLQSYDAKRSGLIFAAISNGYLLTAAEPVLATSREPVVSNCQKRRTAAQERVELEVPQVLNITQVGEDGRMRIVVDTIADSESQDQVGDKTTIYSMVVADTPEGWKLTSIAGIETGRDDDE